MPAGLTVANLQPLPVGGNGAVTDLQLVVSENSDSILVFLGTAVLERIRCSREALEYKMLVGRLVNAGWSLSRLQAAFGRDPRTMKRWAAAGDAVGPDVGHVSKPVGQGRGRGRRRRGFASGQERDFDVADGLFDAAPFVGPPHGAGDRSEPVVAGEVEAGGIEHRPVSVRGRRQDRLRSAYHLRCRSRLRSRTQHDDVQYV